MRPSSSGSVICRLIVVILAALGIGLIACSSTTIINTPMPSEPATQSVQATVSPKIQTLSAFDVEGTLAVTGKIFPTSTTTPILSITPHSGFQIWDVGSLQGYYAIQFPESEWVVDSSALKHKALQGCSIGLHGGSDICMSGGCRHSSVVLGDAVFNKTTVGETLAIYVSTAVRSWIAYEIRAEEQPKRCILEGEEVLASIIFRPERGCSDRAEFVEDITVPDNTSIPAGTKFIKTWRIKNVGTCTWLKGHYTLLVMGKTSGTESDWAPLQENVQPQQVIDLSVELPAPTINGIARWEGILQNELGDMFGLGDGPYADIFGTPFWVQINVVPVPTP